MLDYILRGDCRAGLPWTTSWERRMTSDWFARLAAVLMCAAGVATAVDALLPDVRHCVSRFVGSMNNSR